MIYCESPSEHKTISQHSIIRKFKVNEIFQEDGLRAEFFKYCPMPIKVIFTGMEEKQISYETR